MRLSIKKIIAIVSILGVGGAGIAYSTGVVGKPSAGLIDKGDWVDGEEIQVESSAYVYNPNPIRLNLSRFSASYSLRMNGVKLAEGEKNGLKIPQNDNRTLNFRTDLETDKIPAWWVSHLVNDEESDLEIPIDASLKIGPLPLSYDGYSYTDTISTDIEGSLSSALSKIEGNYSRRLGPETDLEANKFRISVRDASARFGEVSRESTELVIPLRVHNPNSYSVPTPQMGGNLKMNDIRIAEFTANNVNTASEASIPPGETRKVVVKADMSNQDLDKWFRSHVRKNEKTDAELKIYFEFDVSGASVRIPSSDGMTCRFDFATEILVDEKAETSGFKGCEGIVRSGGSSSSSENDGNLLDGDSSDSNGTDNETSDSNDSLGGLL